jgi:hypothetical protein
LDAQPASVIAAVKNKTDCNLMVHPQLMLAAGPKSIINCG